MFDWRNLVPSWDELKDQTRDVWDRAAWHDRLLMLLLVSGASIAVGEGQFLLALVQAAAFVVYVWMVRAEW